MGEVGIIGLGPMAENIVINVESRGYSVSLYNRTYEKVESFLKEKCGSLRVRGYRELREFVDSLSPPRLVILMVKAGKPVDDYVAELKKLLSRGDIVLDFGNSHFRDTERRYEELLREGIRFLGVGVSGGVEGALKGPSIMVGGDETGYAEVRELLRSIAAKYNDDSCEGYFGRGGAGHFVKIVHNGIEYAMLGGIAEVYQFLRRVGGLSNGQIADCFSEWNGSELGSYLLEAASQVLRFREEGSEVELVEKVVDEAEQKGTGMWASEEAMRLGVPAPSIDAAVTERIASTSRGDRLALSKSFPRLTYERIGRLLAERLSEAALYGTYVMSYSQGLSMLVAAIESLGYQTEPRRALRVWRSGCIIRSKIVQTAYESEESSSRYLFSTPIFTKGTLERVERWKEFIRLSASSGLPIPVISSAFNYFLMMTSERLPTNLIQAIRDLFGAHGFRRSDREGEFHSTWRLT
ncbi:MAG: NADP-dependent phosphogluconate dehydrogenase [Aigarchaeota archaeon]|nr:NADP-dependent phosphogluconate dehydrogenase [Aigarchaeota archaeon]MDW8092314.1 NADP-dependent phosphogluconate dehydrogenase [Nitrososphaerota archaeon]